MCFFCCDYSFIVLIASFRTKLAVPLQDVQKLSCFDVCFTSWHEYGSLGDQPQNNLRRASAGSYRYKRTNTVRHEHDHASSGPLRLREPDRAELALSQSRSPA